LRRNIRTPEGVLVDRIIWRSQEDNMQYVIALLVLVALLVGGFALLNRPHFVPVDYNWSLNRSE